VRRQRDVVEEAGAHPHVDEHDRIHGGEAATDAKRAMS
jgi:hypothetical protein